MKFTRHLHKKPEILLYDSSFSYQQVTQPWANSVTHTTRITRSKLPDAPTHSRLDFSTRHNPAGSLNHYATLTSQDHCTGFEGCQHPSSIATEHLKPVVCFHNHSATPFTRSCCDFRLQFKTPLFVKAFLQTQSTELCYWYQAQVPTAAKNTLPHCAYLCWFLVVSL